LCASQFKKEKLTRLYDPYYCNGRTLKILKDLGYENVIHEKRDFYMDISNDTVPAHDIFITNPPFSDSNKTQCLSYCFRNLRHPMASNTDRKQKSIPFLLLMPAYVAAKQYFRDFLSEAPASANDIVYLIPSSAYTYDHPENTGKDCCPFESMWFLGLATDQIRSFQQHWESLEGKTALSIATSYDQLQNSGIISAINRPNPKQRRRLRKRMHKETSNVNSLNITPSKAVYNTDLKKPHYSKTVKPVKYFLNDENLQKKPLKKKKRRF
jgi:hypothetical protein